MQIFHPDHNPFFGSRIDAGQRSTPAIDRPVNHSVILALKSVNWLCEVDPLVGQKLEILRCQNAGFYHAASASSGWFEYT